MSVRDRRDEDGMVLVWFALLLVPLLVMAALSVDVGRWYVMVGEEQKAADAASLAGVVHMPGDLDQATIVALSIADKNGFSAARGDLVAVTATSQPNQLKVTITTRVENLFATVIGLDTQTITRSAVAEFQGPTPMGSPINTLGNEPVIPAEDGVAWRVTGDNPQHWLEISGPQTPKQQGDRYSANNCSGSPYACSGSNDEWSEKGYFYVVRVRAEAADVGKRLVIQLYDPALVHTGDTCGENMGGLPPGDRYTIPFCTGDHRQAADVLTEYRLFEPTPEDQYGSATVPQAGCDKSWNSFKGDINTEITTNPTGPVATSFHRWNDLCRVIINEAGVQDFLLQVRTTGGNGHNRYAIRTGLTTTSGPAIPPAIETRPEGGKTSMFAAGRLPIFANLTGADSTFYLARVLPGAGGSTLRVGFYDTGDAAAAGRIIVLPPVGSTSTAEPSGITRFRDCVTTKSGSGTVTTADDGCTLTNVHSGNGYNGQLAQMLVPIPEGYSCNQADPLACWVTVTFDYPDGTSVQDTTTWDATIDGDPVRLVQ